VSRGIGSTAAACCSFALWLVSIACGHPDVDPAFAQQAYVKASNTGTWDFFGYTIALSGDGNTLAVGAIGESSDASGIDGDQASDSAESSGAVYVFTRSGATWSQQAYVKASNSDAGDRFGSSIALSADGNTLAVGASGEASAARGINGVQADNSASQSGAVYVFTRVDTLWAQEAYIKASNADARDQFGYSLALSADGNMLAVGAPFEASAAIGINGNESDNSTEESGAAYVFTRAGTTWSQHAYIKASNTGAWDAFGYSVALSGDATTLAVGAWLESSAAIGINGDQGNDASYESGAAYVFARSNDTWAQQAYIKASNTDNEDHFGISIALSNDGGCLVVGADSESSGSRRINGVQNDNTAAVSGAAYLFSRSGTTWSQDAYVKASNADAGDLFGASVALSADGNMLVVGAYGEDSDSGIDGSQSDNSKESSGAAYVFTRSGSSWTQESYLKASNPDVGDLFGFAVALSADGGTVAAGAYSERSTATGINGGQGNNAALVAGAAYVFVPLSPVSRRDRNSHRQRNGTKRQHVGSPVN
jgi:hypothetical protein